MDNKAECPNCGDPEVECIAGSWQLPISCGEYETEIIISYCPFCGYKLPEIEINLGVQ